ncbi:MAG: hypothetical protein D6753_09665 [Planctomycetota bacterium]|nr:MAG: hypothetical protein D6753_09665 [Planctomycetota bacterium]
MLCAVGFSARSLVQSIRRANIDVVAIDHFCDQDLCALADDVFRIPSWCTSPCSAPTRTGNSPLLEVDRQMAAWVAKNENQPLPSVAAGGVENFPALVEVLQRHGPFLGPPPELMRDLRSVETWKILAAESGLRFPTTVASHEWDRIEGRLQAGRWLLKPENGAGGLGIQLLTGPAPSVTERRLPCDDRMGDQPAFLQEFIPGRPLGVVLIVHGPSQGGGKGTVPAATAVGAAPEGCGGLRSLATDSGDSSGSGPTDGEAVQAGSPYSTVLGVTESWAAADWPGPRPFIYRGSWGPIPLPRNAMDRLLRLGDLLYQRFGVLGMMGADVVLDPAGDMWLLELNPRWTAGMEVLSDTGCNPVPWHLAAWAPRLVGCDSLASRLRHVPPSPTSTPGGLAAKAVVYAPAQVHVDQNAAAGLAALPGDQVCDLPRPLSAGHPITFDAGHPLCTVKATIRTTEDLVGSRRGAAADRSAGNPQDGMVGLDGFRARILQRLRTTAAQVLQLLGTTV